MLTCERASLEAQLVQNLPARQETPVQSLEKGMAYPLQYSWTSLVAQTVKNLPAMRETWVQPLGREDALEKGAETHALKSVLNEHFSHLCNWGVERGNRKSGRLNCGTNPYSDPFRGPSGGRERRDFRSSNEKGNRWMSLPQSCLFPETGSLLRERMKEAVNEG